MGFTVAFCLSPEPLPRPVLRAALEVAADFAVAFFLDPPLLPRPAVGEVLLVAMVPW